MHERSLSEQASGLAENEGEQAEEARTAKPSRDPRDPTGADRAMHEATHVPFRSCAVCVGRRENPPHRRVPHDENAVPEILIHHYSEPSKHGSSSEKSQISMPLNVIQRAVKGLRSFGHRGRAVTQADNEPAILALKEEK